MRRLQVQGLIHASKRAGSLLGLSALATSVIAAETLEEIIVTARKVEESVQDVPMSVQVLSAELLDQLDLTRLIDLQFNVPGLVVNNRGVH
ncbi:MAG: hypothetical protein OEX74_16895, partial [Gammaproteobacteria bacterium]|nr:hypothetical protein [Gammaproteobacteria bacterium]